MFRSRLSVGLMCSWIIISGVWRTTFAAMATDAPQTSVHQSKTMCAGERSYIEERKEVASQALEKLGIQCPRKDLVPRVALLGSGGGERAATALLGSLYQMEKDGLLDLMLYIGGVSGSTWAMAALYNDPMWSTDMDRTLSRLLDANVELNEVVSWLNERSADEYFSLSDVWGATTSGAIMNEMTHRNLSEEATRNASNPYPVYCAVEKNCCLKETFEGKWFEVSPHEAGYPELDLFVETSLLGSEFKNGELVDRKPEMDLIHLQGILGSALADIETVKESVPLLGIVSWEQESAVDEHLHVFVALHKTVAAFQELIHDDTTRFHLKQLKKLIEHHQQQDLELIKKKSQMARKNHFHQWCQDLLKTIGNWSLSLTDETTKQSVHLLVTKVIPLVLKWEWGTTHNFLYQLQEPAVPECLRSIERINLVDAGLVVNVGYPSFLGEKRDIDIMIVPESSAGVMFETLTLARDYAAKLNKPFPVIDPQILEEREWPKDCYVFEGKEKEPTIVYMPLFNRKNCKDAAEVKSRMSEFATFQLPLRQEQKRFLVEVAKTNMKNNKDVILGEIRKVAARRQTQ